MMTNAQAALIAAASMYSTGAWGESEIPTVTVVEDADAFKDWLDKKDEEDRPHKGAPPSPARGSETTVAHPDVDRYLVN